MKKIILSLFLILSSAARGQLYSNIISKEEFNSIKINSVTINDIRATEGLENKVTNLNLGTIKDKRMNDGSRGPLSYWYQFDGLELSFSASANNYEHPGLGMFKIANSKWIFTILGKSVRIGDNINILGDVNINNKVDNNKNIIYQFCNGCNSFIYIDFNKVNSEITKIGFIEQT